MTYDFHRNSQRLALIGIAAWLASAATQASAAAGDIYPEYAQFYTQNHKAAQKQANKLDNEIAQYNIPVSQALDRPGMHQMYEQMGKKDSVAQPDFNPSGAVPIQSLDSIMRTLGSGMFNMSDASSPMMKGNPSLGDSRGLFHFGSKIVAPSYVTRPLATRIAATSSEKKIIDNADHADYQKQNQSGASASDTYPTEQQQRPCASADPDRPC